MQSIEKYVLVLVSAMLGINLLAVAGFAFFAPPIFVPIIFKHPFFIEAWIIGSTGAALLSGSVLIIAVRSLGK